ncbi:uncharacterized protein At1g76660-like isoform X1 [Punica granatum]|uniref:Uncharacterized protein At1g76660-like isoform X1 n=1 Tax=Punica granatum TaxID=22663 RepID=A0A6P8CB27_PUNGR|nr:uncharacterized protein At1g76660-like isoform X1 [Punica granatum]
MGSMGSEQIRVPPQQQERRKRWGGCLAALSCFGAQKGGKRIVPASRVPEGNAAAAQPNRPQANQATTAIAPSLLAPPSSPASFTNSALPSTAQSPSNFLSANSPGGPSSMMFATGPFAHETQLVSPPVFSTFTTEPSTAPLTPPPELAHLSTTPSSPEVPYARYLLASRDLKGAQKENYVSSNDLQATYPPYPESPASSLRSPISRISSDCLSSAFPDREAPNMSHDTNFFCPATFAEFYLDQNSYTAGRLSVSKDSDVHSTGGNGYQSRQNTSRSPKQDAEEIEAYRASFGFSADEIITTAQYVEIADVADDSFTIRPPVEENLRPPYVNEKQKAVVKSHTNLWASNSTLPESDMGDPVRMAMPRNEHRGGLSTPNNRSLTDSEQDTGNRLPRLRTSRSCRKYPSGLSSSDAEIEYRRGRSLREGRGNFSLR